MRTVVATIGSLWLIGCAATSRHIRGPDGEDWVSIRCRRSQANCYEAAGEACPGGYDVADNQGRQGVVYSANAYGAYAIPTYHGEMLIKCKGSHEAQAQTAP